MHFESLIFLDPDIIAHGEEIQIRNLVSLLSPPPSPCILL